MATLANTLISINGGELYILASETKELPKEVHIDSIQILPLIYEDHTFTFDNSYGEKLYKLKWVFEVFREENGLIRFIKSSKFQFYRYFTTKLNIGDSSIEIEIPSNSGGFRISPSGGNGNMDNRMAFMSVKPESILDWRPTDLIVPHETYQQIETFGQNILKFNTNKSLYSSNTIKSSRNHYYIIKSKNDHYQNTINILGNGWHIQNSNFNNEINYYYSFLKVFSIAKPFGVVFINSGVTYQNHDLPIIFDKLIFDMINHFSIEKNLTVIVSAGNHGIDINEFIAINPIFDFLNTPTKAVVVGAMNSNGGFDSNHGAIVDCYARTPINGFGQSSAASARIAQIVANIIDFTKSTIGVNLTPHEIKNLLKDESMIKKVGEVIISLPTLDNLQKLVDSRYVMLINKDKRIKKNV